ncbi:hypothetical protein [Bacillus sp. Brlt_9]|uniref:hypothetical protein n=1 Tax=Bacillus sp. Brlt_9 TaxID=3110916 RepID=UPI003F7C62C7
MRYNQLSEGAKNRAVVTAFEEVQEKKIDYSYEKQIMRELAQNSLFEFHCKSKNVDWEYEYGLVDFTITDITINLESLLSDNVKLLDVWKEIMNVSTEKCEIEVEVLGRYPIANFKEDYEWENIEKKLEYMKLYAAEYDINVDKYEIQLIFGANIEQFVGLRDEFEIILRKNGLKIANYVLKKAIEMVGKMTASIDGHIKYIKSEEYVKEYLENNNDVFDFDISGERLIAENSTENN